MKSVAKSFEIGIEEKKLIEIFNQLQSEGIGCHWRKEAAIRLGWSLDRVKKVCQSCNKKGLGLVPSSIEDQVMSALSSKFQTAKQIWSKFPNFKYDWIHLKLESLGKKGLIQVMKRSPKPTLYKLKELAVEGWCKNNYHSDGKRRFGKLTGGICIECMGLETASEIKQLSDKINKAEEDRANLTYQIREMRVKMNRLKEKDESFNS